MQDAPIPARTKEAEIPQALEELERELVRLEKFTNDLVLRIQPVLNNEAPKELENDRVAYNSPMAVQIAGLTELVVKMSRGMYVMLNRLEI